MMQFPEEAAIGTGAFEIAKQKGLHRFEWINENEVFEFNRSKKKKENSACGHARHSS